MTLKTEIVYTCILQTKCRIDLNFAVYADLLKGNWLILTIKVKVMTLTVTLGTESVGKLADEGKCRIDLRFAV